MRFRAERDVLAAALFLLRSERVKMVCEGDDLALFGREGSHGGNLTSSVEGIRVGGDQDGESSYYRTLDLAMTLRRLPDPRVEIRALHGTLTISNPDGITVGFHGGTP